MPFKNKAWTFRRIWRRNQNKLEYLVKTIYKLKGICKVHIGLVCDIVKLLRQAGGSSPNSSPREGIG